MFKVLIFFVLVAISCYVDINSFLLFSPVDGTDNIEARYVVQVSAVGIAVTAVEVVLVEIISMV